MNKKTSVIRFIIALAVTTVFFTAGKIISVNVSEKTNDLLGYLTLGAILLCLVLLIANIIARSIYVKSKSISVQEAQEYYLSRKDAALNDLPRTVRKMVLLRRIIRIYSAFLLLTGLFLAFSLGFNKNLSVGIVLIPFYLIYGFTCRIMPRIKKFQFDGYTNPADYPVLHALSYRAAKVVGITGTIRICIMPDSNAGIAKVGSKSYSLQLGAELLDILTEEELYQILIHEFAHLTKDGNPCDKEYRLFAFITERDDNSLTALLNLFFGFTDNMYIFEYTMYRMTASLAIEQLADSAILKKGNSRIAANALAKTNYCYLFGEELNLHLEESYYQPEEPRDNAVRTVCDIFRRVLPLRSAFWREILMNEIQPRSASHPIFRNRMQALGVSDFTVTLPDEAGDFRSECRKAVADVDKEMYEMRKESYREMRKENYEKPLAVVEEYRARQALLKAEEARPVMDALIALGYTEELEALCDRILETTENVWATPHAHMVKGMILLERYDKAGIDHIYRAIELNKNYLEEGLNKIGQFCCLMGLQEELDVYREKAVSLQQNYKDEYSHTGELKASDRLSKEEGMPQGMLEGILSYIKSIDEGSIEKLYLVRKTVSDTFFASVFVVKFKENTEGDTVDRVMDKIFNHLDTHPADWQFSLFLYNSEIAKAVKKVNDCVVFDAQNP